MDIPDVLDRAADILVSEGRIIYRAFDDDTGKVCASSAILLAAMPGTLADAKDVAFNTGWTNWPREWFSASSLLADYLRINQLLEDCSLAVLKGGTLVARWNDSLPPTPDNDALVVDHFRFCAKELR